VISQTQEVHEEVVDLLEQLRRMQDLQVTIEVRFITLNDNFFERIGVDFNFKLNDGTQGNVGSGFANLLSYGNGPGGSGPIYNTPSTGYRELEKDHSMTIGLSAPGVGNFASDLDIPFTQGSYTLAVPQFGGFNPSAGASIGFAILSEIEAYFFINAAQGDQRTNVLQAPKVTLFNGQMAFVSDTSQSPFVISVIPVVGDFAAAQQPVIVVLSEGTFLTVQAVVSNDRRFVRLTLVPFFSTIGKVETFTFAGYETTTNTSSQQGVQDEPNDNTKKRNSSTTTKQGTTVQLPTFAFVTVTTTVSVPDGGTVLLGGIKRLSEGRSEFGVPILAQIPYINRLFKNVGIGRETSSLMMMVTPRIIIQEEEEERLGIQIPPG
jgi:general secretion pathway protein D